MATSTTPKYPATEKQVAFIQSLRDERNLEALTDEQVQLLGKKDASAMITDLMDTPIPAANAVPAPSLLELAQAITHGVSQSEAAPVQSADDEQFTLTMTRGMLKAISGAFMVEDAEVGEHTPEGHAVLALVEQALATKPVEPAKATKCPEGHYAVTGEDGTTDFYLVEHGKPGSKWAAFVFLSQQLSDEYVPVKGSAKGAILGKIESDPLEAAKRYGVELGVCGVCHKTLTNPDSIAAGIGPVCAAKLGGL